MLLSFCYTVINTAAILHAVIFK